jgi:GntR family transcriptional regulator
MQVPTSLLPRYYQLHKILENRIQAGEFQHGDKFPTDEELCKAYNLSRGTVRRAIDMLVEEGVLRREQGRGTFVTRPNIYPVYFRLADFNEEMRQRGLEPGTRLLELGTLPADPDLAVRLGILPGEKVIQIVRLRLANGKPMAVETRFLSFQVCPQLLEENLEIQSIHKLLIEKFNIPLVRACYSIEARVLSDQEADLLQVAQGTAGFLVERTTYTLGNHPVTWFHTVYRGDRYRFIAEMHGCDQPGI